jgi:putative ABC transport system permease protein
MFRNCLAAALRHLSRNRLYTAISVAGMAVGLCVALMAGLVIRNQYSYDHDLPGYERTWTLLAVFSPPGLTPQYARLTVLQAAAELTLVDPQVEATSRVLDERMRVERDGRSWRETVYWADANLPDVLPMPVYAGDIREALRVADGVVLSRSYARRFFGRDAPLGAILTVDGHPMVVRALIEDPRPNTTHEQRHIIAAGTASFSTIAVQEREPGGTLGRFTIASGLTYLRLRPGTDVEALTRAAQRLVQPAEGVPVMLSTELVRIDRLNQHEGLNPGFRNRMMMLGLLGAVVLLVAGVNFVNLLTARSMLRAREVAIRGVAGARRGTLIAQFLGEALIHAGAAALLALALAEWLLPRVNAFLDTGAVLAYDREPWLIVVLVGAVALFGLLAGAWPAFVQSRARPLEVLRGGGTGLSSGRAGREILVALQFALLIALAICAGVVHLQREFALHEALRVDHDQVLMIATQGSTTFAGELRKLPGVRAVTRANTSFLGSAGFGQLRGISITTAVGADGQRVSVHTIGVDFDVFDFYGIKPLAGRLPPADGQLPRIAPHYLVVNETAARRFGLGAPDEALEKELPIGTPDRPGTPDEPASAFVLAVVPDFSLDSVAETVPPTVYYQLRGESELVNVRLTGGEIPEALAAIDSLWAKTGNTGGADVPFRFFLDEHFQRHYQGVLRQSQAFGICALLAIVLSCVGLFALTAAAAERRTKEIGIRKALGASTGDVMRLLLWQFSKPALWANLIAWPVSAFLMHRWLEGFAYRMALPLWLFPAVALAALMIALGTVAAQAWRVVRSKPVAALRYE